MAMCWHKTSCFLPPKGESVLACDITEEGQHFYITHLYRRQSKKRNENWWHQYFDSKDCNIGPDYWTEFPEIPEDLIDHHRRCDEENKK